MSKPKTHLSQDAAEVLALLLDHLEPDKRSKPDKRARAAIATAQRALAQGADTADAIRRGNLGAKRRR